MPSGEATNTIFIAFGLICLGLEPMICLGLEPMIYLGLEPMIYLGREPMIYRTRGEHNNHYTYTGMSRKQSSGVKVVLWAQTSPLSEMISHVFFTYEYNYRVIINSLYMSRVYSSNI